MNEFYITRIPSLWRGENLSGVLVQLQEELPGGNGKKNKQTNKQAEYIAPAPPWWALWHKMAAVLPPSEDCTLLVTEVSLPPPRTVKGAL